MTKGVADENNDVAVLQNTVAFLDVFSDVCFTDVTGLLRDVRVHVTLARDVEYSLYSLNKTLAAHREAWRYVGRTPKATTSQRDLNDVTRNRAASLDEQYERKRWRDEMKERSQLWRERARPGLYGALFGPEEMEILSSNCLRWTSRLRQTLELIFLTMGPPTPDFWTSQGANTLGVNELVERQHRAGATPSGDYNALQGHIRGLNRSSQPLSSLTKTIYNDGEDEVDVIVEPRPDTETPTEFMCHLTWLLQAPTTLASKKDNALEGYQLHTLRCMGFIDDPLNARSLILYRSPQSHPWASSPPSLYDLILKGDAARMSLGNRYLTARGLATSLLETHASGWIHGNIQARSIAMLPRDLNDSELSPFLVGWGVLQPLEATYFALEPNLYRHHDRFGKPSSEYANQHDIYSLGVVLLELGLWKTIGTVFARRIEKNRHFDAAQQQDIYGRIHNAMLDWANSVEVEREMGKKYAQVVLKCLTWHDQDPIEGMIEFRKHVVDVLTVGSTM